jgi:hypothetical protein
LQPGICCNRETPQKYRLQRPAIGHRRREDGIVLFDYPIQEGLIGAAAQYPALSATEQASLPAGMPAIYRILAIAFLGPV